MALTSSLFQCNDPKKWQQVSDIYWEVVEAMGAKKKRLVELDRWFQEELPAVISARPEKSLKREELVKLMEWKLLRGKFRPRLQQMAASNPESTVESCSGKAFQHLPDISAAIEELCQLKGIGPATASGDGVPEVSTPEARAGLYCSSVVWSSAALGFGLEAILCAAAPEHAAFMADEAVESVPGLLPIQYNLKHYLKFLEEIRKKAEALNADSEERTWTPHRVELSLWAWKVGQKLCPELLETLDDAEERPTKKLKSK